MSDAQNPAPPAAGEGAVKPAAKKGPVETRGVAAPGASVEVTGRPVPTQGPTTPGYPTLSSTRLPRRDFFITWGKAAWGIFTLASTAGLLGTARFMFPNVLFEPPQTFKAGFPSDFSEVGRVYELYKEKFGTWLVRDEGGMFALSTVCTHLGCTPNWLGAEGKFKCPCHGSGFRKTGIHFEGPAPRPLERYRIVMADDGQVLVDKTRKYQQEKGQWEDPESYLIL